MKKLDSKGFGAVEALLIIVIVGLIGSVGYFVYGSQKKTNTSLDNTAKLQVDPLNGKKIADKKKIELINSNVPEGWAVDMLEAYRVDLRNESKNCFVNVISTSDTTESNSPKVDQNKQTIEAIKAKGDTVTELAKSILKITTQDGTRSVESLEIDSTADVNTMSQSYGFVATERLLTIIQVSCATRSDLENARQALTAIRVNL